MRGQPITSITIIGVVDLMSYWTFSDIFEEAGWPTTNIPFHNGFGLMNVFGVPKPGYR